MIRKFLHIMAAPVDWWEEFPAGINLVIMPFILPFFPFKYLEHKFFISKEREAYFQKLREQNRLRKIKK